MDFDVINSPAFYAKHCHTLHSTTEQCILTLGNDIPEGLLYHIWYSIVAHIKNVIEVVGKKDSIDVVTEFLTLFKVIIESNMLESSKILVRLVFNFYFGIRYLFLRKGC